MRCAVCSAESQPWARAHILGTHEIQYYRCENCGFIRTEPPFWLAEAYADSIARSDIGLVSRNLALSRKTAGVISLFFDAGAKFLDYGGGNGMFVRLMRDRGYDFEWSDRYTENRFAAGFEAAPGRRYELVTAFEVFEHLPEPLETIGEMLERSPNVLFSTRLLPATPPYPGGWWYYALDTGQHVSFYSRDSLRIIARKFGRSFCSDGESLHLFTTRKIPERVFASLCSGRLGALLFPLFDRRKSLLPDDYRRLTGLPPG